MDNTSKFDLWWNSPRMKRIISVMFSLGASMVIIGALFKILHWNGASYVLSIGMFTEAFIFALGALDKPFEDVRWSKIFDFENGGFIRGGSGGSGGGVFVNNGLNAGDSGGEFVNDGLNLGGGSGSGRFGIDSPLSDEDAQKLSESIKNLTITAKNIASISDVVKLNKKLVSNLETAADTADKFIASQESLNSATEKLGESYQNIYANMERATIDTQTYGANVEEMNRMLSSINIIYSIQLQNITAQNEALAKHTETIEEASSEFASISGELKQIKTGTNAANKQTAVFAAGTEKLAKQISDLNAIYGNMLNALH